MEPSSPLRYEAESRAARFAREVVVRLREAGHEALWAGGCVRDLIRGDEPADYDVATDAVPDRVIALFPRTVPVGMAFGVVRVLGPGRGLEVEVATFRADGEYRDGRRPSEVRYGTASEDALRRDFTINGMYFDPVTHTVIDYVGGRADLDAGLIRAIGDPEQRFSEDKLRLIRAVRFAGRFGFTIEPATAAALARMASTVKVVAAERIAQELFKILEHPSRAGSVRVLHQTGLLAAILPEVDELYDENRPGENLGHLTERVLNGLPARPAAALSLAALLHRAAADGPAAAQADRAHEIARRLRCSTATSDRVRWLVANQNALRGIALVPPSARKRLMHHKGMGELIALDRAIRAATGEIDDEARFAEDYLERLPEGPLCPPPLVDGNDLMRLGHAAGPGMKHALEAVRTAQLDGRLQTRQEALDWLRNQSSAS